jgi:hypothetical protein
MAGLSRSAVLMTGAIVACLGALAIAIPVLTTSQTRDVAKIGDMRLTATEETSHVIPPLLGPAALVLGAVLIGAAFVVRR